jgi:hypothetical protein
MPPDKTRPKPAGEASTAKRGRPRRWASPQERRQVHQQRRRDRERQVNELLHAVSNAWWDEPELQQIINHGDDLAVLTALTAYYQGRHWRHGRPAPHPGPTTGAALSEEGAA